MDKENNGIQAIQEKKAPIMMGNRGIELRSFEDLYRFSTAISVSGLAPKGMEKAESIMIAIQLGLEIGLSPMKSLQSIAVINGKPSIYGDSAKAMVLASPVCEYVNEYYEGEGDNLTAVCKSKRFKGTEHVTTFSVTEAKKAGLWNKNSVWSNYGKRMLMMRARGFELRDNFADVLGGYQTFEEVGDYREITQGPTVEAKVDSVANTIKNTVKKIAANPISAKTSVKIEEAVEIKEEVAPVQEKEQSVEVESTEILNPYSEEALDKMSLEELKEMCVDNNIDYNIYEGKNTQKKLKTLLWEKHNGMPYSISEKIDIVPVVEKEEKAQDGFNIPGLSENGFRTFPNMKVLYDHFADTLYDNERIMRGIKTCGYDYTSKEDLVKRGPVDHIDNVMKSC